MTGDITFNSTQQFDGRDVSADGTKLDGIATSANNYSISSDLLDEDNMASDSATKVASQQSIKAYVDAHTGATDLSYTASSRELASSTGTNVNLPEATTSAAGLQSSADKTKLDGIETAATADQTGAEIKSAYEGESDTNAFTDADHTKLDGIATGAEVNVNADWNSTSGDSQILNKPTLVSALNDLSDVSAASPSANQIIKWNGSAWALAADGGGGSDIFINTLSSSSGSGGGSATFNGTATRFTLSNPPSVSAQQLLVSINGVVQKPNSGTSPSEGFAIDGNDIIFAAAPATGSDFFIVTYGSLNIAVPADNSVTSAKIVDGAIVNDDINASAAIDGTKIAPDFGSQNIVTTGGLTVDTNTLHVDTTNNRIGIGTLSPSVSLDIEATTPTIRLTDSDASGTPECQISGGGGDLVFSADRDNEKSGTLMQFQTDGSTAMTIDSSGNVMVGITSSPSGKLHVEDSGELNAYFVGNTSTEGARIILQNKNTAANSFTGVLGADAGGQAIAGINFKSADNANNEGYLTLGTRASGGGSIETRMLIDSSGNVGIKQTDPRATLDLGSGFHASGVSAIAANYQLGLHAAQGTSGDIGRNIGFIAATGGQVTAAINSVDLGGGDATGLSFITGNASGIAERMVIDASGRIRTGGATTFNASTNADDLQIGASGQANQTGISLGSASASSLRFMDVANDSAGYILYNHSNDELTIGSTSLTTVSTSTTSSSTACLRLSKNSDASNAAVDMMHFISGNQARGKLVSSSSDAGSPALAAYSDYRIKENIRDYTGGWDNIKAVPVKIFDVKTDGSKDQKGWIAHELQAVLPDLVQGTKDAVDEDDNPIYQSVSQGLFMPDVISALQTAIAKIETLETKIAALEGA